MGNFYMESTQINYRRDDKLKTVDQKLQELSETSAIDTDIAPVFKSTNTYHPGDMVYYRNKLYVFNVEHTGAWAAGDVTATDVTTEVSSLRSGFTNLDNEVNGDATVYPYADVITIEDTVPSNLAGCTVKIVPVQSGSGDPSPTNVRPITGHTEASVEVTDGDETTKTYTLALGDTIYGGEVDFKTGVMTITQVIKDFSDLSWSKVADSLPNSFKAIISGKKNASSSSVVDNILCSCYKPVTGAEATTLDNVIGGSTGNSMVYVTDSAYTDADTFKTARTGQTICYELATPTTIQLTPEQIQLLQGTNTLYASTGDISVTVNGVSGSIGQVQEQVNEIAVSKDAIDARLDVVESKLSSYVIVRSYSHLCSLVETNASYEFDIEPDTINGYTALLAVYGANDKTSALLPFIISDVTLSVGGKFTLGVRNTTVNDIANVNLIYYIVYVKS